MTVWYRGRPVGHLKPDHRGGFLFSYTDEWVNHKSSFSISISLPIGEALDQDRADAFFTNLLPEGPGKERHCLFWPTANTFDSLLPDRRVNGRSSLTINGLPGRGVPLRQPTFSKSTIPRSRTRPGTRRLLHTSPLTSDSHWLQPRLPTTTS